MDTVNVTHHINVCSVEIIQQVLTVTGVLMVIMEIQSMVVLVNVCIYFLSYLHITLLSLQKGNGHCSINTLTYHSSHIC